MCCKERQDGCQKPENLTGKPENCSEEQIRKCHGDEDSHPCVETSGCEHPEHLQDKPGNCSEEQIRKCHGDSGSHSCDDKI